MQGDAWKCREMQGDAGRCMEMQGDAGRCKEVRGDGQEMHSLTAMRSCWCKTHTWHMPSASIITHHPHLRSPQRRAQLTSNSFIRACSAFLSAHRYIDATAFNSTEVPGLAPNAM